MVSKSKWISIRRSAPTYHQHHPLRLNFSEKSTYRFRHLKRTSTPPLTQFGIPYRVSLPAISCTKEQIVLGVCVILRSVAIPSELSWPAQKVWRTSSLKATIDFFLLNEEHQIRLLSDYPTISRNGYSFLIEYSTSWVHCSHGNWIRFSLVRPSKYKDCNIHRGFSDL
jgi:hypothetical protein